MSIIFPRYQHIFPSRPPHTVWEIHGNIPFPCGDGQSSHDLMLMTGRWLMKLGESYILILVGGLEHQFYFPRNIGNFIIPIDELIFFRGVAEPPTRIEGYKMLNHRIYWRFWNSQVKIHIDPSSHRAWKISSTCFNQNTCYFEVLIHQGETNNQH